MAAQDVELLPGDVRVRCYGGNPLDLVVQVTVNGQPVDMIGWVWRAEVLIAEAGQPQLVPFATVGVEDGVQLFLTGAQTERIAGAGPRPRQWPLQVFGRNPAASQGYTILRGYLAAEAPLIPTPAVGPPLEEVRA